MKRAALPLILLLLAAAPIHHVQRKLPPLHQCDRDPAFAKFHSALEQAIKDEDFDALVALTAPDVLVDDGARGQAAFVKTWTYSEGAHEMPMENWELLRTMMQLGCARTGNSRVIPSTYVQFAGEPGKRLSVVASPAAKLREINEVDATVIGTLNWDVVTVVGGGGDWQSGVRLADGREGYLWDTELYDPAGYRFVIEKRGGEWKIAALVTRR